MSNANETVLTDEVANEAFLAWMRTAPMMKDDDHPMPICFIAGYKAALATQGTIANDPPYLMRMSAQQLIVLCSKRQV